MSSVDDAESQENELCALESIYEECFVPISPDVESSSKTLELSGGLLWVHVDVPSNLHISFLASPNGSLISHSIDYLPPLCLDFRFPHEYPSKRPPNFTLSCKWLNPSQISILCAKLDDIWVESEHNVVLFDWYMCLQGCLSHLKVTGTLHLETVRQHISRKNGNELGTSQTPSLNENIVSIGSTVTEDGALSAGPELEVSKRYIFIKTDQSLKVVKDLGDSFESPAEVPPCLLVKEISLKSDLSGAKSNKYVISRSNSRVVDDRAIQDIESLAVLIQFLLNYNEENKQKAFNIKLFPCNVCYLEKCGIDCIRFWPCDHVYCKVCMQEYFETQITEGNIMLLRCPEEKCTSEANPKQVEGLVSSELFMKWENLLLNMTLSSLGDIQPCPRRHCQYPVTVEANQGQCPECSFVFCSLCRMGAHGVEKCRFKSGDVKKVLETYLNSSVQVKESLESKYGKKYLNIMLNEYLSATYIETNAKECPRCRANIEKFDGCNKMTCKHCNTHFCWLCGRYLDLRNPYQHFNHPSSECFNRLFEGVGEDEDFFLNDDDSDDEYNE